MASSNQAEGVTVVMSMQEDARKGGAQLETAHRAWNDQWQSDAGRADWLEPDLDVAAVVPLLRSRSEEHTSELQSLIRISYAVFCLKKKSTIQRQVKSAQIT